MVSPLPAAPCLCPCKCGVKAGDRDAATPERSPEIDREHDLSQLVLTIGSGPAVTARQHYVENCSFSRDVMRQSSRAVLRQRSNGVGLVVWELREILLEGLMDIGSCALLEPAEPHPDQFPNTGLSIRPFVDHGEPLRLVRAQRQNDPSSGFDLIEDRRRQSLGGGVSRALS